MEKQKTWNQYVVKKENKSLVLETVRKQLSISRANIASVTSLNKGTVSSLVSELMNENLIYESGPGKSSGGRRPVILHFNKVAGYSIGIDLGVNYMLGLLTDLEGNIITEKYIDYNYSSYDATMEKLFTIIDYLIAAKPTSNYGIVGIGVGVPGAVNNDGDVLLVPNLNWKDVQIKELIERKYNVPVIIENEANAGAYGEKKYGVGKQYNHIIYVSVGIGIGVGMIFDRKLYKGNNGFSGELGHMTIELNGKQCNCGNTGCWELYASEKALATNMDVFDIPKPPNEIQDLDYLLSLTEENNDKVIQLFEQIGEYLGLGINNIVNIFNPEQVIIGNRMSSASKWLETSINKRLTQSLSFQKEDLRIDFAELSTHSAALGMAAFSVDKFLINYQVN